MRGGEGGDRRCKLKKSLAHRPICCSDDLPEHTLCMYKRSAFSRLKSCYYRATCHIGYTKVRYPDTTNYSTLFHGLIVPHTFLRFDKVSYGNKRTRQGTKMTTMKVDSIRTDGNKLKKWSSKLYGSNSSGSRPGQCLDVNQVRDAL